MTPHEVMIVAGEPSGDMHAAAMVAALRERRPELHLVGVGGSRLAAEGVELLERAERIAVVGFVEVIKHLPILRRLMHALRTRMDAGRVRLLVVIDYPGFNMRLVKEAKKRGVPVLYYITPQVWAWHKSRVRQLRDNVTVAAVILPFEEQLLRDAGVNATFVGSPLIDATQSLPSREDSCAALGLDPARPVLSLFPGSRAGEIGRHLTDFVATARAVVFERPEVQVIVSAPPSVSIDPALCPYPVARDKSHTVFRASTAAMCKSGTTTLEAALCGCPLVVAYRTSAMTYAIAKRLVTLPNIALVNIVAEKLVAPEFIQDELRAELVAPALLPLLDASSPARVQMLVELAAVRMRMGAPGAASRVAAMVDELVP
ncbi:MAG TPA: lipid-A-disaccharide synthase [Gemmatimonadaceae bacterium]|nr:lipid-A-disaccharide synthase [Gemmatimonadaceae bacterium]